MIDQTMNRKHILRQLLNILPVLFFVLMVALSWVTAYFYANNILDSDASSELVLANLLAKENAIMSTNWIYSNEIRVIQTNLVFAPLMKLFANWHTVRYVGILLLQSILLLSYFYLCKQLKLGRKATYYSAAMLILPFSVKFGRIVLYHTYYLPFITIGFLLVGMLISVINHHRIGKQNTQQWLRIIGLLILSFLAGINGVRQLMVTMTPMLLTAFFVTWKFEKPTEDTGNLLSKWGLIILTFLICVMGAIGYYVNDNILGSHYTFYRFGQTLTSMPYPDGFNALVEGYFSQFGYQTGRILFSLPGLLALSGLFIALFFSIVGLMQFSGKLVTEGLPVTDTIATHFVKMMFPTSVLTMLLIFIFAFKDAVPYLYLIPAIVWAIPLLACLIQKYSEQHLSMEKLLLVGTCVLLLGNGIYNNAYFIQPTDEQVTYDGLSWRNVHTVSELQGAVDYLSTNGYEVGYASFWNANIITEMTSGKIPMIPIYMDKDNPTITYYNWLTNPHYQEKTFVEGRQIFLLLRVVENDTFVQTPLSDYGNLVYEDENTMIYGFDDFDQPWSALQE